MLIPYKLLYQFIIWIFTTNQFSSRFINSRRKPAFRYIIFHSFYNQNIYILIFYVHMYNVCEYDVLWSDGDIHGLSERRDRTRIDVWCCECMYQFFFFMFVSIFHTYYINSINHWHLLHKSYFKVMSYDFVSIYINMYMTQTTDENRRKSSRMVPSRFH